MAASLLPHIEVGAVAAMVIGFVGYSTFREWRKRMARWTRLQRFLHFAFREQIDVVVTTHDVAGVDQKVGFAYDHVAATLGNVKTLAAVSKAIGDVRSEKDIVVHLSGGESSMPDRDLILIGGAKGNSLTGRFLRYIGASCADCGCDFDEEDESCNYMSLAGNKFEYDWTREAKDRVPSHDFGLVVVWVNPFSVRRRRAILCTGFTSYGTYAAAAYLFKDLVPERYGVLTRRDSTTVNGSPRLPSRWRPWKWPHFAVIVEVAISPNGQVVDIVERAFTPLSEPTFPVDAPATFAATGAPPTDATPVQLSSLKTRAESE